MKPSDFTERKDSEKKALATVLRHVGAIGEVGVQSTVRYSEITAITISNKIKLLSQSMTKINSFMKHKTPCFMKKIKNVIKGQS